MNRKTLLGGVAAAAAFVPSVARAATPATANYLPLYRASGWIGDAPTHATLDGRVVLVDVFTFECINCTNVTPTLRKLYGSYRRDQLEIIAVHTPEVPSYQSKLSYLARQTQAAAIPWPIAIDNDRRIWDAYGVSAWPTQLIFDRTGRLRAVFVGEGYDEKIATTVSRLVAG
jgi:thiol-disulfide isomerase/thioredoxin